MTASIIDNLYAKVLLTDVRNIETSKEVLCKCLYELGRLTSEAIVGETLVSSTEVITPMGQTYSGFALPRTTTIISTRDDYEYFAEGVRSAFPNSHKGYMDFRGERGQEALQCKRRAIEFPVLKPGVLVETLIVAKSVLATGCTAITLTKTAVARYQPRKVIVAPVFYSQQGIEKILTDIPNLDRIYAHGSPDLLNDEGMLMPGVGNLDSRMAD